MRRFVAILIVAALAAPGLWWRSPPPVHGASRSPDGWNLAVTELPLVAREAGELEVVGAWQLTSRYPGFGAYSALAVLGDGRLLAASDTGRMLAFAPPGAPPATPLMDWFAGRKQANKFLVDIEAMTRDPATGRIWLAYEGLNAIERFEPDLASPRRVRPGSMRAWPGNTGPEALLRLADGRFLVLSEAREALFGAGFTGLLFASDPVEGGEPIRFEFVAEDGFRPVDAAQAPDGRVVILLRRFDYLPPGFENRIVVADPADIREGVTWRGRPIGAIAAPLPTENYEGMVAEPLPGGAVRLWLISDDNRSALQRTLLMALRWDGR